MRARDLATPFPAVQLETATADALQLLLSRQLPGLIVVDPRGRLVGVLPAADALRLIVPFYCLDEPGLARVFDEAAADLFFRGIDDSAVIASLLPVPSRLAVVGPNATVLEIAVQMVRSHSPIVAVIDGQATLIGAITLTALLDRLLEQGPGTGKSAPLA